MWIIESSIGKCVCMCVCVCVCVFMQECKMHVYVCVRESALVCAYVFDVI